MKTISEILLQIKADAAVYLADIITTAGLELDVYEIGQSRDESQLAFFVYQDKVVYSYDANRIDLVYQLQLPGVSVADAAKYSDAVFEWIKDYDFNRIGMTGFEQISIDTWPNAKDRNTIIFFDISVFEYLDSCDQ